ALRDRGIAPCRRPGRRDSLETVDGWAEGTPRDDRRSPPSSTSAPSERSADVHERSEPSAAAAAGATGRPASALRHLRPPQRASPPAPRPAAARALGPGAAPAGGEG